MKNNTTPPSIAMMEEFVAMVFFWGGRGWGVFLFLFCPRVKVKENMKYIDTLAFSFTKAFNFLTILNDEIVELKTHFLFNKKHFKVAVFRN